MRADNSAIVIIPSECFRWRARVRFMDSFPTRAAALNYAFQHGCNLIVESNEGGIPLCDVMQDPDGVCTADLDLELLKTEEVLVDPYSKGWTALMLSTLWHLAKRIAALVAILYAREVVPFSRRAAAVAGTYLREVAPLSRRAASRCWWSNSALAFRRGLHRHSHGTVSDLAKRFAAIGSLHLREIARRISYAASRCRWSDVEGASRRAWGSSLSTGSRLARQFAAAVARTYHQEIAPFSRHLAAFASLYLREIAPILCNVAAGCWSDSKSVSRRQSWAVAALNDSNSSQLR